MRSLILWYSPAMETPLLTPLHERLQIAAGSKTYRQLGDATGLNSETVRRYMQGHTPSVDFLASVCAALDINAQWLLVGAGPMKGADIRSHALGEANVSELLSAMSATLERLMDRVDRLETYMQTLETHLRAGAGDLGNLRDMRDMGDIGDIGMEPKIVPTGALERAKDQTVRSVEAPKGEVPHAKADAEQGLRARISGVLNAVSKRSRSSAD